MNVVKQRIPHIVLVYRKPNSFSNSIEFLFHQVYGQLKDRLPMEERQLPKLSRGVWNRIRNAMALSKIRNSIVHVTGDTHYVILGAVFCTRVLTIHDLSFLERTRGLKKALLKLFWVTLPVRFSHRVTVVSEATKDVLLQEVNMPGEKVTVIRNFIDDIYQPVARNFNSECPRILQIGTNFNKNLDRLLPALEGMNCRLVIIGRLEGDQEQKLLDHRIDFENKYALTREELHQEFLKADMLSFISTVEGFGLPILEAQATGLPVITSNCSSMPEVAGKGALLVDPLSIASIREGYKMLIENRVLREQLVQYGYVNSRKYSLEAVAECYRKLYLTV